MRNPDLLIRGECKKQIFNVIAYQSALESLILKNVSLLCYVFNVVSQEKSWTHLIQ